jgi:hypothetical protein
METQILSIHKHVFHFYGSNNKHDKWPSRTLKIPDQTCYTVDNKDQICIGHESKSYPILIFDGLISNDVIILGKVNHVVIRMCKNTSFTFGTGTIGGIHVIKCSEIDIKSPIHDYISIEYSNTVDIHGQLNVDFLLYISSSLNVSTNGERLKSTAFTSTYYDSNGEIV